MTSNPSQPVTEAFVALVNGPTLPVEVIELALDLENRGFRQSIDSGEYSIEPTAGLSEGDRVCIARWGLHLGAIVAYSLREATQ